MKKLFITFSLAAMSLSGFAQTAAGNILVGANLSQSGVTTDNLDTAGTLKNKRIDSDLQLNVRGGYFIADNVAVGLLLGYASDGETTETITSPTISSDNKKRSSTMRFGAFARMYKMLGASKFGVFGQLDLTYGLGSSSDVTSFVNANTTTTTKNTGKHTELRLIMAPGVSYFFSEKFAIEATIGSLGYVMRDEKDYGNSGRLTGEEKVSTTHVNFRPWQLGNITVGLTFFFGGGGSAAPATK